MSLFNFFRKSKKTIIDTSYNCDTSELESNEVYFHEDMFCQVEFSPAENLFYLKNENKKVIDFTDEHFDGSGYTDIYIRNKKPIPILDKKIPVEKLNNLLIDLKFKRIDRVYYGYGSAKWISKNTAAYTFETAKIFVNYKELIVENFWIDDFRFHEDEMVKTKLKEVLSKIGAELNVVLSDWNLSVTIDLKNEEEIDKYLNEDF